MDALLLRPLSRLQTAGRQGRRIQRQVHGGSGGAARRLVRDTARSHPRQLPQFLPAGGALAIFWNPFGRGSVMDMSLARAQQAAPPEESFADSLFAGLGKAPKEIACKYFYDQEGSQLFERICTLPEYYQTR